MAKETFDWDELLERLDSHDLGEGWVSLGEASAAAGISMSTLRSWYRSGQIRSHMVAGIHGPERRVPLQDVIDRSLRSARLHRQADKAQSIETALADLTRRIAAIEARLGIARATD